MTVLLSGIQMVSQAGYRMSFTVVDQADLVWRIRQVMPDAIIVYRYVFGDGDRLPVDIDGNFVTGQAWFDYLWPYNREGQGADYFQFVNEWLDNEQPIDRYRKFATFYTELGAACRAKGITPTYGDFSPGTPPDAGSSIQGPLFAALGTMYDDAVANGIPINMHLYSPEGAGAFDMEPGAPWFLLRFEQTVGKYPTIKIIGGEGGNAGIKKQIYDPEGTPRCMRQAAGLLRASRYFKRFLGLHWWGVVNEVAHPDWKGSDCTGALPWFFAWSIQGQPA